MTRNKRILVCPLDWGLGHAARCVPVIHALREAGAVPVVAADNGPLLLLLKEFPELEHIRFPGVAVSYPSSGGNMFLSMLRQSPKLLAGIRAEKKFVEQTVSRYDIQGVVSDNRFGAFSTKVPSAYITHQIHIQTGNPFTDALARMQHARYMKRFGTVWIPDVEGAENLSGKLSHGKNIPAQARYIGPLSRMTELPAAKKIYDAALVLSGPEPQRTLLEEKFLSQIQVFPDKKFLLIRGKNEPLAEAPANLTQIPLANHAAVARAYAESQHIICRSGYTGIMEMAATGRSAWLVPTPGQTEQEYLARHLKGKYGFNSVRQEQLDVQQIMEAAATQNRPVLSSTNMLEISVHDLLRSIRHK